MDFDDEENPKEVTKTRRFAPCRAGKSKPKPKPEPTAEKAEPSEFAGPKVNMEIYSKVNKEPEADLMEVDRIPLQEEEEEEDVVVREIDVFFNPSIEANTKLYVLQYPLRPSWRPYEMDERCREVRVNPSTSQVEFDLSMDVHSRNYDSEFGSKLQYMTKQTLTTTWKQPPTLDYAVGVLSGDELHLNPVHAVAQLRPSMHYLSSKKKQEEATQGSVETSKKQVYINSLCRGGNCESKHSSKRVLTSLPLEERVQKLLCQGPPLFRYSVLKHYAPELSDMDFLVVVKKYAWLVQGLWTPKTSLLKLDPPIGASRDYVLMLFSKGSTIKYCDVEAIGHLRDKMKTMLIVFAKERPLLCDWKFKEPTDVSFIKSYPEIAKEQADFWKAMDEKLTSMITKGGGRSRVDNRRNVVGKNPSVTVKLEIPITLSDKGGSSRNTPKIVSH